MSEPTRYCADCKFCVPSEFYGRIWNRYTPKAVKYAHCNHPTARDEPMDPPYDLLHPKLERPEEYRQCVINRKDYTHLNTCGPTAKYWEARK